MVEGKTNPGNRRGNLGSRENRHLTRIESGRAVGWWFRLTLGDQVIESAFFSDRKHGGKESALCEARKHRDEVCKRHHRGIPAEGQRRGWATHSLHRNERGVKLVTTERSGKLHFAWLATYYCRAVYPKQRKRSYSVNKYGFDRARKLAIRQRRLWETGEV